MLPLFGLWGLAAIALLLALTGCGLLYPEASYRFRMEVDVQTPAGLRSGSSVFEVSAQKQLTLTAETRPLLAAIKGQAVIVDLPEGPIFVLLRMHQGSRFDSLESAATFGLAPEIQPTDWRSFWKATKLLSRFWTSRSSELPPDEWPYVVRFRDVRDPTTIEEVPPSKVGIKEIRIKTTHDAVTTGIEKRLPWLPSQRGALVKDIAGSFNRDRPIATKLIELDFTTERF
jgi:hypothetical protein